MRADEGPRPQWNPRVLDGAEPLPQESSGNITPVKFTKRGGDPLPAQRVVRGLASGGRRRTETLTRNALACQENYDVRAQELPLCVAVGRSILEMQAGVRAREGGASMIRADGRDRATALEVLRWVLRIYALVVAAVALLIAFAPDPYADPTVGIPLVDAIGLGSLAVAAFGLVAAWRWELWGGAVATLGVLVALASSCAFGGACPSVAQTAMFMAVAGFALALPGALFIWLHVETRSSRP